MVLGKANLKTGGPIESRPYTRLVNASTSESVPAPSAQQTFLKFPPVRCEQQTGFPLGMS